MCTFLFLFMGSPSGQGPNPFAMWLPIIILFVIVYLLVLRPLAKRRTEAMSKLETITTENQRYKTLLAFGKFFSLIGWIVVIVGVIIFSLGLSQVSGFGGQGTFIFGPAGLLTGLLGLILVASGQGISCFVSIESNTHDTMVAQQAILRLMREQTQASAPTKNLQTQVEKLQVKDEGNKKDEE